MGSESTRQRRRRQPRAGSQTTRRQQGRQGRLMLENGYADASTIGKRSQSTSTASSNDGSDSSSSSSNSLDGGCSQKRQRRSQKSKPRGRPVQERGRPRHRLRKSLVLSTQKDRHKPKDELPFVWLFIRVAAVVLVVALTTNAVFWAVYKSLYKNKSAITIATETYMDDYSEEDSGAVTSAVDVTSMALRKTKQPIEPAAVVASAATAAADWNANNLDQENTLLKKALAKQTTGVNTLESSSNQGEPMHHLEKIPQQQQQHDNSNADRATSITTTPLSVQSSLNFDAFDIAQRYEDVVYAASSSTGSTSSISTLRRASTTNVTAKTSTLGAQDTNRQRVALFWQTAASLRRQFAETYGGQEVARQMLARGLISSMAKDVLEKPNERNPKQAAMPDESLQMTACRLYRAKQQQSSLPTQRQLPLFKFAFGGYSVTAGRGNYFRQSFPLVMEQQLHTIFRLFGLELTVMNAAIGGCPSFPYGFCLSNFWGNRPDVVSWDFSMNEAGGDPVGLEAYLRHIMSTYAHAPPKLIVKDTYMATDRVQLLEYYANFSRHVLGAQLSTASDPVIVHTDPATEPFLKQPEADRPLGFREWRKFGAPPNAPGQSLHHPAVKEHELIAWMLTMHFLSALELVAVAEAMKPDEAELLLFRQCLLYDAVANASDSDQLRAILPVPKHKAVQNSTHPWNSILFGKPVQNQDSRTSWRMNSVQCRTTFEPIVKGSLSDIVVAGSVGEDIDAMLPKSSMYYNAGWVLDYSDEEKKAKRNLNRFGGLGFIDNKKAYYGVISSGTLQLLLPYGDSSKTSSPVAATPRIGDVANKWFTSVIVCEVNEKRSSGACNAAKDVHYTVGGINATDVSIVDTAGTRYLGKRLCVHIVVPKQATLTSRNRTLATRPSLTVKQLTQNDEVGLLVTATIHNSHIHRREDACSISHVVWEQS